MPGKASSRYTVHLADGARLALWGFGVFLASDGLGGAFLNRYKFVPAVTLAGVVPDAWTVSQLAQALPGLRVPSRDVNLWRWHRLFIRALDEVFAYEQWVRQTCGPEYRRRCLAEWGARAVVSGDGMPKAWLDLADACDASLGAPRRCFRQAGPPTVS